MPTKANDPKGHYMRVRQDALRRIKPRRASVVGLFPWLSDAQLIRLLEAVGDTSTLDPQLTIAMPPLLVRGAYWLATVRWDTIQECLLYGTPVVYREPHSFTLPEQQDRKHASKESRTFDRFEILGREEVQDYAETKWGDTLIYDHGVEVLCGFFLGDKRRNLNDWSYMLSLRRKYPHISLDFMETAPLSKLIEDNVTACVVDVEGGDELSLHAHRRYAAHCGGCGSGYLPDTSMCASCGQVLRLPSSVYSTDLTKSFPLPQLLHPQLRASGKLKKDPQLAIYQEYITWGQEGLLRRGKPSTNTGRALRRVDLG